MKTKGYKAKQILWASIFMLFAALLLIAYALQNRITTAIYTYEQQRIEASFVARQASTIRLINTLVSDSLFQVCGGPALSLFRHEELELLVCGLPHFDFDVSSTSPLGQQSRYVIGHLSFALWQSAVRSVL